MTEYQARGNISVNGGHMAIWEVRDLPDTPEVAHLAAVGLLVPKGADGEFFTQPPPPVRCCGR